MKDIVLLICGGRNYKANWFLSVLNNLHVKHNIKQVIYEGDRKNRDEAVRTWAKGKSIKARTVSHEWETGPIRNEALLSLKPDMVVAFPGGAVQHNLIRQAEDAGIPVVFIT